MDEFDIQTVSDSENPSPSDSVWAADSFLPGADQQAYLLVNYFFGAV